MNLKKMPTNPVEQRNRIVCSVVRKFHHITLVEITTYAIIDDSAELRHGPLRVSRAYSRSTHVVNRFVGLFDVKSRVVYLTRWLANAAA
jgi:hypothetical protein